MAAQANSPRKAKATPHSGSATSAHSTRITRVLHGM